MRTPFARRWVLAIAAISLFFVPYLLAAPFLNPSFELNGGAGTNTFTSWTVVDQAGGSGSWFVQTGVVAPPPAGGPVPAPTNGAFAAMSSQSGPGSHILYQDITVTSAEQVLRFDLYIKNQAAAFFSPASLDYTTPTTSSSARTS